MIGQRKTVVELALALAVGCLAGAGARERPFIVGTWTLDRVIGELADARLVAATLSFDSQGKVSGTARYEGLEEEVETRGTYHVDGDRIVVTTAEGVQPAKYSISGGELVIEDPETGVAVVFKRAPVEKRPAN